MDHENEEAEKHVDTESKVITEGKAEVLLSSAGNVFYNPVQEFNRDLRYMRYISDGTVSCNQANKFSLNVGASTSVYGPDFLVLLCCNS
jgi:tRNA G26 N,N-dimethylase Trm1